jgi:hypothetical protein
MFAGPLSHAIAQPSYCLPVRLVEAKPAQCTVAPCGLSAVALATPRFREFHCLKLRRGSESSLLWRPHHDRSENHRGSHHLEELRAGSLTADTEREKRVSLVARYRVVGPFDDRRETFLASVRRFCLLFIDRSCCRASLTCRIREGAMP